MAKKKPSRRRFPRVTTRVLVAYVAALIDRIDPDVEAEGPSALILVPTATTARRLAEWTSRLTTATGHSVAALGSEFVFVVTFFWFVRAQEKIDRDCGVAEEE